MAEAGTTRVGITGHQSLQAEARRYVSEHLEKQLRSYLHVVGVTSLAGGADQLFAELVLLSGGKLSVVVPSERYEESFTNEEDRDRFWRLKSRAAEVKYLPFKSPTEEAYWAAGKAIVDDTIVLFAVWDGRPARGLGGTADVVNYAREQGHETIVIWPAGVERP